MNQISELSTQNNRQNIQQTNSTSNSNHHQDDRVMSVSYVPRIKKYFYNRATHRSYNKVCYQLAEKYNDNLYNKLFNGKRPYFSLETEGGKSVQLALNIPIK